MSSYLYPFEKSVTEIVSAQCGTFAPIKRIHNCVDSDLLPTQCQVPSAFFTVDI